MLLGAVAFFVLMGGFYAFSFGATRLLLRRSAWEQYSLEAPWLTGTPLVILSLSAFGYHDPHEVPTWQAWTLLIAGWAVSALVAWWDRAALAELMRVHGKRWLVVTVPAGIAAAVMLAYFPGNIWDTVHVPWISEYLDYAELAAVLTGHHQGEPGSLVYPFCEFVHTLRYGQDLPVAMLAQLGGLHPMQAILPLVVLIRFQQAVTVGLLVCGLSRDIQQQWKVVVAVLLLDAVLASETLFFGFSFFSSNCTTPLFTLYLVWLACQQEFGWRECIIVLLMNLFFFLTYPEFMVMAKGIEAMSLAVAWWRSQRQHWQPLLVCNLALFAMHPLLVLAKIDVLRNHLGSGGGWSVFGDPLHQPLHFISCVLGMRYGHLPLDPLRKMQPLLWLVYALALPLIAAGLFQLARRPRMLLPLLVWLALLVATHISSFRQYGHYYAGFKFISHTYFVVILGVAALLLRPGIPWRKLSMTALGVWLVAAVICAEENARYLRHDGYTVSYAFLRDALATHAQNQNVAVLCERRGPLQLVNMAAAHVGVPVAAVTDFQLKLLARDGLCEKIDCTSTRPDGVCFEGVLVVEEKVLESGKCLLNERLLLVESTRLLCRRDGLVLCEGRVQAVSSVSFPRYHWIWKGDLKCPQFMVASRQLRLTGEVAEYHKLPYRLTCGVGQLDWSQEVVVDKAGPFEVVLNLPENAVGKNIVVEFKDFGTFRPADCISGSIDTRDLGFMLLSVGCDQEAIRKGV